MSASVLESWSYAESNLAYCAMGGFFGYVICVPFYRSRKSFWDAIAARHVIGILRILIMIEAFSSAALMYFVISFGSPVPAPYNAFAMTYGTRKSSSWIFSYPRPVVGIVVVGLGAFGDMHPFPRILCMLGAMLQVICDGLSYVFVEDYLTQTKRYAAPLQGNFTSAAMGIYIYRDLLSLAVCVWIVLLCGHLSCLVGWCEPQLISYQMIVGGHFDRCQVMRDQFERRTKGPTNAYVARASSAQEQQQQQVVPTNDQDWAQHLVRSNINGDPV